MHFGLICIVIYSGIWIMKQCCGKWNQLSISSYLATLFFKQIRNCPSKICWHLFIFMLISVIYFHNKNYQTPKNIKPTHMGIKTYFLKDIPTERSSVFSSQTRTKQYKRIWLHDISWAMSVYIFTRLLLISKSIKLLSHTLADLHIHAICSNQ